MLDLNYISDRKELGNRIKAAREDNNLTQAQLAERIDTKREIISAWEHGRQLPGLKKLSALCKALDVDMGYLFGEYDSPSKDMICACQYTGLSEKAVKILRSWNKTTLCSPVAMLSRLIEQREDFGEILYSAWNYATNRAKAKNMNKKLTGKKDEHIIQVNTGQPNTQELLLFTAATRITSCIRNAFK